MSNNIFIPKVQREADQTNETVVPVDGSPVATNLESSDVVSSLMLSIAQYAVIVVIGLLPLVFFPGLAAGLGFDKVLFALALSLVVVVLTVFIALRKDAARTILPISLLLFWLVAVVAIVSALLSGDIQDSLRGSSFETHTAGFVAVMALMMTVPLCMQGSKRMIVKLLTFFSFTACLLMLYNLVRLFVGASFLSFASFNSVTSSPLGGFNDLAIFSALVLIVSLVTLLQLPFRIYIQISISLLIVVSLVLLALINFFKIWVVIAFFSLLTLVYQLASDRIFGEEERKRVSSPLLIIVSGIVFLVSVTFLFAGNQLGAQLNTLTNTDYVEVRPSVTATTDVAKAVYSQNFLLGIGPNRFSDAWREHKDIAINETIFWETNFNAGYGYIPTLFITTGLLGVVVLIAFQVYYLFVSYRNLVLASKSDLFWRYVGITSFVSSIFLWGMSYVYVPGAAILLLAAFFTGLSFVAYAALSPRSVVTVALVSNQRRGFVMMTLAILVVAASVSILLSVSQQYRAQVLFAEAGEAGTIDEIATRINTASVLYPDDRFAAARVRLEINALTNLLNSAEPTEENQQAFFEVATDAITYAETAIRLDPSNPEHYAALASVYGNLAVAGVEGARESAQNALAEARARDAKNPLYPFIAAQLSARLGDMQTAREEIRAALTLKRNYTQALFFLAQVEIQDGNTASAIETTRSIVRLEPNNPTRYFQLGVLLAANAELEEAVAAHKRALELDPQYANARYMLALVYLEQGQDDRALEELRLVQSTNQENEELADLIRQVESGEVVSAPSLGFDAPVTDVLPNTTDDVITSPAEPGTDLISPVNQIVSDTNILDEEGVTTTADVLLEDAGVSKPEESVEVFE